MNRPYKVPGSWPLASLTAGHATITVIVRWLSAVALRKIVLKISGEEQPLSDFYSAVFLEHWSFYETVIFAAVAGFLGRGATVMLAHFSVGAVCASSMEAFGATYGARVAASLRSEVSRYIMTHVTHSDRTNKEQVEASISNNIQTVQTHLSYRLYFVYSAEIRVVLSVCITFFLSWQLALLLLSTVLSASVFRSAAHKCLLTAHEQALVPLNENIATHMLDILSCREVIVSARQEKNELQRLDSLQQKTTSPIKQIAIRRFCINLVDYSVLAFTLTALIVFALETFDANDQANNQTLVFSLISVMLLSAETHQARTIIVWQIHPSEDYQRALANLGDWTSQREPEKNKGYCSMYRYGPCFKKHSKVDLELALSIVPRKIPQAFDSLCLQKATIGYPPSARSTDPTVVLEAGSLLISKGEVVCVTGETGTGKSSVLKTMMGFLPLLDGSMSLNNGMYLGDDSFPGFRRLVFYVSQDTKLFRRSLRENLTYGLDGCSDNEIQEALRKTKLEDFVQSLPHGLDTVLVDAQDSLSGGQRNRIQLARMFLSQAEFLLLDEPTAALDMDTEKHIIEALLTFLQTRTAIIVTHNPRVVDICDRHLTLDKQVLSYDKHNSHIQSSRL